MIPGILCLVIRSIKYKNSDNRLRHIIWCVIYIYYGYLAVEDAAGIGTIWDLISYGFDARFMGDIFAVGVDSVDRNTKFVGNLFATKPLCYKQQHLPLSV